MTGGFGFPFGCVAAVAAVITAHVAGPSPWYALVTLGLVVLATARRTTFPAALGVLAVAWALDAGFVLGHFGELAFDAASAWSALILAGALALGLLTARRTRTPVRIPVPRRPEAVAEPRPARAPAM
ncbi:hypothetical protein VA596_39035 [Amycolatopsis sp., V23-08]|uniref:Uncharacterized protein n=1 Tax=Amycolatopsis heterodermiae TaxID=3110235 RepID=A0ABU5RJ65_9PSEU|nr:hypothetical protein [Amycolatopsis sp., V23-08]MEA5365575.1 hypothetical protein [Amycolatopsis sp., V23-08]